MGRPPGNGEAVYGSVGTDVFAAAEGRGIFIRDWSYNTWVRVDAPGLGFDDGVMVIGDLGVFATTGNNLGDLYQYMYTPGVWQKIGQAGLDYVVTGRTLYRQNHNDEIYNYSGTSNVWTKIHNRLVLRGGRAGAPRSGLLPAVMDERRPQRGRGRVGLGDSGRALRIPSRRIVEKICSPGQSHDMYVRWYWGD